MLNFFVAGICLALIVIVASGLGTTSEPLLGYLSIGVSSIVGVMNFGAGLTRK